VTNEPVVRETVKPDSEYERLLAEEALILDSTELISELMLGKGLTRAELAKRIGKTRGFVTQVLAGNRNMTLRTLADLAYALDARVKVFTQPVESLYGQSPHQYALGVGLWKAYGSLAGTDAITTGIGAIAAANAQWLFTSSNLLKDVYSGFEAVSAFQHRDVMGTNLLLGEPAKGARRHAQRVRRPTLRVIQGNAA